MTATNELPIQTQQDVVVIGGGAAGLATAAELQRRGISAPVLEQGDHVGQAWHDRYRVLRLNSGRPFSALRGLRYRRGTPMYPTRDQVIDYLDAYRERQHLQVLMQTRTTRIDQADCGWTVHTTRGSTTAWQVAVATGLYAEPELPAPLARPETRIPVTHSRDYVDPEPYRGLRVLVVGAGSSGMEIAHDLVRAGAAAVLLSVRTPPTILPRTVAGIPGDPAVHLLTHLPPRLADAQTRLLQRLTIGDLSHQGLPPPASGPFTEMRRNPLTGGPAIVDKPVIDDLRAGRITVVPAVAALDRETDAVHLDDGSRIRVDAVVAAAGFRPGLEPLVGHLGVLDQHGVPIAHDQQPVRPGLHFVNYRNRPGLLHAARHRAPRTARAIARAHRARQRRAHPSEPPARRGAPQGARPAAGRATVAAP
jgi:putative flavoprotein involved in K+ transport